MLPEHIPTPLCMKVIARSRETASNSRQCIHIITSYLSASVCVVLSADMIQSQFREASPSSIHRSHITGNIVFLIVFM